MLGGTIQSLGGGGGVLHKLNTLFIALSICRISFFSHSASSKIFISLSYNFFSVFKVESQPRRSIDLEFMLHKLKGHLMMRSEA